MDDKCDGLQRIIDEALEDMADEAGGGFDPQSCNLAEFCRRTGLTRSKARTIKANGFRVKPHGRLGTKLAKTVLSGHTGFVDDQLRRGVTNSQVVFERLVDQGYRGGLTTVKVYMAEHSDHVPAKRRSLAVQISSRVLRVAQCSLNPLRQCLSLYGFAACNSRCCVWMAVRRDLITTVSPCACSQNCFP